VPGLQLPNVPEGRLAGQDGPVAEHVMQRLEVQLPGYGPVNEDRLDLGGKDQGSVPYRVVQRPDAEPVPRNEQALAAAVPERKGKLAVEPRKAGEPILFEQVEDDLRVGVRVEPVPVSDEFLLQLQVVENLAVEDDPEGLVFIVDRLHPALYADNAEAGLAQHGMVVDVQSAFIGTPVAQHAQHGPHARGVEASAFRYPYFTGNAAHDAASEVQPALPTVLPSARICLCFLDKNMLSFTRQSKFSGINSSSSTVMPNSDSRKLTISSSPVESTMPLSRNDVSSVKPFPSPYRKFSMMNDRNILL